MCASYQVVASCAAYQNTVPKAKNSVVARRIDSSDIAAVPSIHQQSATSTAASIVKSSWSSVARPHTATKGRSNSAGSGGNGSRPRARRRVVTTGRTSWK